ncbi:MAG: flagellar type III secretion system protein FlhB [Burkholderiales bacterium]|nr:flagellar type III secretion system protein FlhB [Burkholderiales bacterium]
MADNDTTQEDRQLEPSAKKLEKARAEGQIARSRDLVHLAVLGTAVGGFAMHGPAVGQSALDLLRQSLRFSRNQAMDASLMPAMLGSLAGSALWIVVPCVATLAVVSILGSMLPGGVAITLKPLAPDFSRLNPAAGIGRIVSKDNLMDVGRMVLLAAALLAVAAWFVSSRFERYLALGSSPLLLALDDIRGQLVAGLGLMVLLLFFSALIDVPLKWWRHRYKLRMTHQEGREEMRESEGDPQVKGQIRARQREVAMARMMAAIPQADVVITNPTHFAVAIRYDETRMGAPRVVAKGADHLAARIREIAKAAAVPMVEAPPLARALYAKVEIDREIPEALYTAVAQVLAYVFQLRRWVPGRGPMPSVPDDLPVPAGLDPKEGAR